MPLYKAATGGLVNLDSPSAIGSTTPNAGTFTNLTAAKLTINQPSRSAGIYFPIQITSVQRSSGSDLNPASISTIQNHNYIVGDSVVISGIRAGGSCNLSALNGIWTISAVPSATSFQYLLPGNTTTALSTTSYADQINRCGVWAYSKIGNAGNLGDVSWDESFFYIQTAGGWKRIALGT